MRRASSRIAFAVSLAVWGGGCDSSTGSDKSIALTLSTNSLALAQGATQQITVTIERSNFDQPVALSIVGALPQGVTASFTTSSLAAAATTTQLNVAVAGNAAPTQSAAFTVRASGEGVTERTQDVTISVGITGTYTLGLLEPELTVAQGGGGNATVLVTRSGGNAGDVALSVGTLPAGVTAAFAQATTTTGAGSLVISAAGSVATGTYPITITSSSPGHTPDQTATLSLVVVAPPATESVTMRFCSDGMPTWLAYRNDGFPWQQVGPSGNGFTFNATARVTVAFVFGSAGNSDFNVYQVGRSELEFFNPGECSGTRNYSGAVSGLSAGQSSLIALGPATAQANASQPAFSLEGVPSGAVDLFATRGIITAQTFPSPDRVIIRRGLDLPTAAVIPELNFGAAEAFAPASATATVTNVPAGSVIAIQNVLLTATGTAGFLQYAEAQTTPISLHFVPSDKLAAGDLHEFYADGSAPNGTTGQGFVEYLSAAADRSPALGSPIEVPTVSMVAAGPYSRPRAVFLSQTEYAEVALARYLQSSLGSAVFVTVVTSADYHGGTPATWDLVVPDFSGAPGFNVSWMLRPGTLTNYLTEVFSGPTHLLFGGQPATGESYRFAYRQSSATTSIRLRSAGASMRRPPIVQYFRR